VEAEEANRAERNGAGRGRQRGGGGLVPGGGFCGSAAQEAPRGSRTRAG
jgi:hypothetical protein